MQISFWPSNRFAFVILIGLLVCPACISEDAIGVKLPRNDAGKSAADAATDTGGTDVNSDPDTPGTGGASGKSIAGSGGRGAAGRGGANGESIAGSSGAGAAGAGGANGIDDVSSCQLNCESTEGVACTSICIGNFDCASQCLENVKSCDAQCASSGLPPTNSSDPVSCQANCTSYEMACNGLCAPYMDENVVAACFSHCADNRYSCERRC